MIQTLWLDHVLLVFFSLIANVNCLQTEQTKQCLVIGQQSIDSCVPLYQSYLTLSRFCHSLTLSSCHILLPFSKL